MRLLRACLVLSAALTARLVRAASPSLFSNTFPLLKRTKAQTAKSQQRERIPRKIPNYMYELYKTLTTSQSLLKPGGMPYDVNAIRAIYSKRISIPSPHVMEMYYDIGYLKEYFTARRDEVHLYMRQPNVTSKNIFRPYVLALHDIHTKKLIRKFKVPAFNHGLQVLSLRGWSNRWIRDPTTNKGLRLTVYRGRRKKLAIDNPFIPFPEKQYPYMILFGDDSDNKLLGWRFLNGYPLNSVSDIGTRRSDRQRRVTSARTQSPQCVATQKMVKLKGRRINKEHIIIEPAHYKITQCTRACRSLPPKGDHPRTKKLLAQTLKRVCCAPQYLQAVAFLVKEPSRQAVTFASVANVVPSACAWAAS